MHIKINLSSKPEIIGVKNGSRQVEFKKNTAFKSSEDALNFANYFNGNANDFLIDNFNKRQLNIANINYIALKKAIPTDFISFSPFFLGLFSIVSEKCLNLLLNHKIENYITINSTIDGYNEKYFTIGFPMIPYSAINFPESQFFDDMENQDLIVNNIAEYDDFFENEDIMISASHIVLNEKIDSDIIYLQGEGVFFSQTLIENLKSENIIGFDIGYVTLNC